MMLIRVRYDRFILQFDSLMLSGIMILSHFIIFLY